MKTNTAVLACLAMVLGLGAITGQAEKPLATAAKQQPPDSDAKNTTPVLPRLPAGVTELKFSEFFVSPIGDRGLTLTDKLRSLDGKRVRILGYMAQQEQPVPGMFLFSAIPVRLNEEHYGLADDLPAATLFVSMPKESRPGGSAHAGADAFDRHSQRRQSRGGGWPYFYGAAGAGGS